MEGNVMKPIHEHDCIVCKFLGNVFVKQAFYKSDDEYEERTIPADLWKSCQNELPETHFILRYSSDGPDYSSFPARRLPDYLVGFE
jgi:hypothetical protein